jgi:hypothetical protein
VWKSVPFTRGKGLAELLGLLPSEEMLGWIHLGTATPEAAASRPPLDVSTIATVIDGGRPRPFGT